MVYLAMTRTTMRHAMAPKTSTVRTARSGMRSMAPRSVLVRSGKVADMSSVPVKDKKEKKEKKEEDIDENGQSLSTQQVEMFLNVLCEETDIAEVELKLSGFKLKVRRNIDSAESPAPAPAAAAPAAPAAAPVSAAPAAPVHTDEDDAETEDDASVMAVKAPKVGVLRRGRYMKGKQIGKGPVVEEGATVKSGQVLCYIEQLGTFWPVESPQAGEVQAFLVEEGEAIEYLEEVVEIAPFFGGHIIGDSKYA